MRVKRIKLHKDKNNSNRYILAEIIVNMLIDHRNIDHNIGVFISDSSLLKELNDEIKKWFRRQQYVIGQCNERCVVNKTLNIKVFFDTMKKSKKHAENIGRGMTLNTAIFADVNDIKPSVAKTQILNMTYTMSGCGGVIYVASSDGYPHLGKTETVGPDINLKLLKG